MPNQPPGRYAVVPIDVWREMFHKRAEDILAEFTAAGNDPEKVTAAHGKIFEYNTIRSQVEFIDK